MSPAAWTSLPTMLDSTALVVVLTAITPVPAPCTDTPPDPPAANAAEMASAWMPVSDSASTVTAPVVVSTSESVIVASVLWASPLQSVLGIVLLATGVPAFWYWSKR